MEQLLTGAKRTLGQREVLSVEEPASVESGQGWIYRTAREVRTLAAVELVNHCDADCITLLMDIPNVGGCLQQRQGRRCKYLALFGSAVRHELRSDSDVDLLVEFMPEARIGFMALARMQREFGELFQRPVDLVPRSGLKPLIRNDVLASAQVLCKAKAVIPGGYR